MFNNIIEKLSGLGFNENYDIKKHKWINQEDTEIQKEITINKNLNDCYFKNIHLEQIIFYSGVINICNFIDERDYNSIKNWCIDSEEESKNKEKVIIFAKELIKNRFIKKENGYIINEKFRYLKLNGIKYQF